MPPSADCAPRLNFAAFVLWGLARDFIVRLMDAHVGLDFVSRGLFANQFGGMTCEIDDNLTSKTTNNSVRICVA
jgi:hypothetical protein